MLTAAALPPQLAERIQRLREDEDARERLEHRVREHYSARRREKEKKHGSGLTPRGLLVQQLIEQEQPAVAAPAQMSARKKRVPSPPPPHLAAAVSAAAAAAVVQPLQPAGPPPPLPRGKREPWIGQAVDSAGCVKGPDGRTVTDVIERARAHRARDPLEVGGGSTLVRRREKGLELRGAFRCGRGGSDSERLARVAASCAPLEAPLHAGLGAAAASSAAASGSPMPLRSSIGGGAAGHLAAAQWVGGDFVQTRIAQSTFADTSLLSDHRAPYVDAARREKAAYRQRDRAAESLPIICQLPRIVSPREALPARSARGHTPRDEARGQIDEFEMQSARMLISTGLSCLRQQSKGRRR